MYSSVDAQSVVGATEHDNTMAVDGDATEHAGATARVNDLDTLSGRSARRREIVEFRCCATPSYVRACQV